MCSAKRCAFGAMEGTPSKPLKKGGSLIAIYHCSLKIVSRGKGKSAVAAAAYRSGTKLVNEWDGLTHDYTRKSGVVYSEIFLPAHAPPEFQNRSILWNSVEQTEKSKNAQLAREIEIALPNELPRSEQIRLVRNYCALFVKSGMCVDASVHDPPNRETENIHAHILLTLRSLQPNGQWAAKCHKEYDLDQHGQRIPNGHGGWKSHRVNRNDWNDATKAEEWRAAWAEMVNQFLEENGLSERVDHRSYCRQGLKQIPTVHLGVAAAHMEKNGLVTEKGNWNREITRHNRMLKEIRARLTRLYQWTAEEVDNPPSLLALLEESRRKTQEQNGTSRYGKVRALKDSVQLFNFLRENDISSMTELREKVVFLQADYYRLRGSIRAEERQIALLKERMAYWQEYAENREWMKRLSTLKPKEQVKEQEIHQAEILRYEAAGRYLSSLREQGILLTPKRWQTEMEKREATKKKLYEKMNIIRKELRQMETMQKAAKRLRTQENHFHEKVNRNEPDHS